MATEVAERLMSAEEFLLWEREQPYKHELIDNQVVAMTGASRSHENIVAALVHLLLAADYEQNCDVYAGGMKVQVDVLATYTYPDVVVVCNELKFRHADRPNLLVNPTLLFEVLSPSTEQNDRNQKLEQYLQIPSLMGYFLVAQDKPLVEAHTRSGDDWLRHECAGLDSALVIPALDCEIPLSEIYRRVRFEEA